jgi:hypothetical protein
VAGISIGTLYQYFPDKAAIVDDTDGGFQYEFNFCLRSFLRWLPTRKRLIFNGFSSHFDRA